jgi:peptidoglycan/xylan/chitin deacetylase (PgdA/CDA1 family)
MPMSPVRFDRLVSLYLSEPLGRAGWQRRRALLPILMYHSVSSDPEEGVEPYYRVATNPRRFAEQMQWLRDLGYMGLALEKALPMFDSKKANGVRPVAITFDDGFRDFYTEAWPVLRKHGFSATLYLPTGFVSPKRKVLHRRECLTWAEVRELWRHGMHFGSHTINHRKLYQLSWDEIECEAAISKDRIQQELQEEITGFAYPYAFPQEDRRFTQRLGRVLREAGFRHCATTMIGRGQADDDPFFWKRLPANSCDDKALFAAKLDGAYDWLGLVQRGIRFLKKGHSRTAFNDTAPLIDQQAQ